jgi:hypothetical protein
MKLFRNHKKMVVAGLALTVALLGGGTAFAYFTSHGTGTGSAKTGTASAVSISQVGAGYDSLIATNAYSQDQCFSCTQLKELGNKVTLSTSDASQLTTVVVAVDNWGAAVSGVPMTFSIDNTVAGPISDTVSASFVAATNPGTKPSETNVVFDFSSQGAFVDPTFTYGITFNTTPGAAPVDAAGSLNVALSSSATDLSVGTDAVPGSIWMLGGYAGDNNLPVGTPGLPTATFSQVMTNYGPWNPADPGAYGNEAVTDDIPAVQVNVVGGAVTGLYPGATVPLEYAITNPGTSPVYVSNVSASVDNDGHGAVTTPAAVTVAGCLASWYLASSPQALDMSVSPGTTLVTVSSAPASSLTLTMTNPAVPQDACQGADVGLAFTSN